jgi:Concanavalin A-like lectin/glucanases superfamily
MTGTNLSEAPAQPGVLRQFTRGNFALAAATAIMAAWTWPAHAASSFVTEAGYHMDEASGATTARDFTGHGHNGALSNVTTGLPGRINRSYSFNGKTSYMLVRNSSSLKPGSRNINISFWIKTTGCKRTEPYDCDIVKYGASSDPSPTGVGPLVKAELTHNGTLVCGFSGSRNHYDLNVSGLNVANGAWHKIVCIKTPTAVKMIVDGTLRGSHAVVIGAIYPVRDLFIAAGSTSGDLYNGGLDEVTIAYQAL